MTALRKQKLNQTEIARFYSTYLQGGGKHQDVWEITHLDVENKVLTAKIRMRSYYVSASDPGGFHLTQNCVLEILSQLMIILVHVLAGYTEKTQEGWMVESHIASKRAVRDPKNITVRMEATSMRKVKKSILISTKSKVSDGKGLFEAKLKGLLS